MIPEWHSTHKVCSRCKKNKLISEYGKRTKKDPRPRPKCKDCVREVVRPATLAKYEYGRSVMIRYKLMKGCVKCGYKEHHAALEFNHIKPELKRYCLSSKYTDVYCKKNTKTKKQYKKELANCEVLCANCHNIHTYGKETTR